MKYLTIHHMDGDADELLHQKQEKFDPVVNRLAGTYGALFSITAKADQGLIVINVWESAEAAAEFSRLSEIVQAQRRSGLPLPSCFERYPDAYLDVYHQS